MPLSEQESLSPAFSVARIVHFLYVCLTNEALANPPTPATEGGPTTPTPVVGRASVPGVSFDLCDGEDVLQEAPIIPKIRTWY